MDLADGPQSKVFGDDGTGRDATRRTGIAAALAAKTLLTETSSRAHPTVVRIALTIIKDGRMEVCPSSQANSPRDHRHGDYNNRNSRSPSNNELKSRVAKERRIVV